MENPQDLIQQVEELFSEHKSPWYRLFGAFFGNLLAFFIPFTFVSALIPEHLSWITDNAILISFVGAALVTIGEEATIPRDSPKRPYIIIFVVIVTIVVAMSLLSTLIPAPDYVVTSDFDNLSSDVENISANLQGLENRLETIGLNDAQINQIQDLVAEQTFVKQADLESLTLSATQLEQVNNAIQDSNFLTESDVLSIIETREKESEKAEQAESATEEANTCYLTPDEGNSSVAIRSKPSVDIGVMVDVLFANNRIRAIGHNGGKLDTTRWWLIELGFDENILYGWISSAVVEEQNIAGCMNLKRAPGS